MGIAFVEYISGCCCYNSGGDMKLSVLGGSDAFQEVVVDFHLDPREKMSRMHKART